MLRTIGDGSIDMEGTWFRRVVRWSIIALVVAYAPVALTATWSAFVPSAPRLQDMIDRLVAGEDRATGEGSVQALRGVDYVDHRILMLVHTVLGAVCLLLAVHQLLGPARWHRIIGRIHVGAVTFSMAAAVLFLLATEPGPGPGQEAFRVQLWVLAASTLGSAWLAAIEARRGRLLAHRAWMTLHLAFLLTAPLLRVGWVLLAQLFPEREMLENIEMGAILLAVAAPAGGVLAVGMPSIQPEVPLRRRELDRSGGLPSLARLTLTLLLGLAVVLWMADATSLPDGYVWFHVLPLLGLGAWCAAAGSRAHVGDRFAANDQAALLSGVAAVPWIVLCVGLSVSVAADMRTGLLTAMMVAPGFPIVASMSYLLEHRSAPDQDSPAGTAEDLPQGDASLLRAT